VFGDISLSPGWNLVPCPVGVPTPVDNTLASIAGQYEAAWGYDPGTGTWQNNMPDQYEFLSNLDSIEPEKPYWIWMNTSGRLRNQPQMETIHFYHPDHLGSSDVITDASGAVVESTEFYPYGRPRYEESAGFDSEYKYTGKELDKESGLMYYEARYYEPVIGRFVSVDPMGMNPEEQSLGISNSLNLYAYALDNPLAYIDPTGLEPDKVIGTKAELIKRFAGIKGTKQELLELGVTRQKLPVIVNIAEGEAKAARAGETIQHVPVAGGCLAITAKFAGCGGGAAVHLEHTGQQSEKAWGNFLKLTGDRNVSELHLDTDAFGQWKLPFKLDDADDSGIGPDLASRPMGAFEVLEHEKEFNAKGIYFYGDEQSVQKYFEAKFKPSSLKMRGRENEGFKVPAYKMRDE
jgi:RHS repeat-associated protein